MDGWDARVLQLPRDSGLVPKPRPQLGPVLVLLQQQFDGKGAVQVRVAGTPDRAHAAPGEFLLQFIPPHTARRNRVLVSGRGREFRQAGSLHAGRAEGNSDHVRVLGEALAVLFLRGPLALSGAVVQLLSS